MSTQPPVFLVVGLNPAYQKILTMPQLKVGSVNRASALTKDVGGKGQNVAKALHRYSKYN